MKLFNAQSKKTVIEVADLDSKVLDTKFLNLVSGGIVIGPRPKLPNTIAETVTKEIKNS